MWQAMKNVRFASLSFILVAGLLAVACNAATSSPTSPSAAAGNTSLTASDFAGTWQVVEIQRVGQAAQPAPVGATYGITFDNNRVSTRQDCNVCGGGVSIADQVITIGPALACTKAACPTMDYETVFEQMLSGDHSVSVQGANLTLSSKRGVLRFTR